MRILQIICLLVFAIHCQSQNVSLKFSFLSLVDEASFPTIQSGIEIKLSKKISWYNEVGIKYRKSYFEMADTNFTNSRGFKIKTEIRYYLTPNDEIYIGCNGFYTKDFHNTKAFYYYSNDSSMLLVDDFAAEKITVKAVLKSNPAVWIERTIWIKKKPDPEVVFRPQYSLR